MSRETFDTPISFEIDCRSGSIKKRIATDSDLNKTMKDPQAQQSLQRYHHLIDPTNGSFPTTFTTPKIIKEI